MWIAETTNIWIYETACMWICESTYILLSKCNLYFFRSKYKSFWLLWIYGFYNDLNIMYIKMHKQRYVYRKGKIGYILELR